MLDYLRRDKDIRDLTVIMVTAENERYVVADAAEYEEDGYLLKPLTLAALDTKIKSVIEAVNHPDKATLRLVGTRADEEASTIYLETGDQKKVMKCFVSVDNSRRRDIKT